jgi:hypothetical protein
MTRRAPKATLNARLLLAAPIPEGRFGVFRM